MLIENRLLSAGSPRLHALTRRSALASFGALAFSARISTAGAARSIIVHKDPNCDCCSGWVRHLRDAGFTVTIDETTEVRAIRNRLGVPDELASCHTAEAEGYAIEGHVPAAAVSRLLRERPDAVGLAVPGMPQGSPGMGGAAGQYAVVLFGKFGKRDYMTFRGTDVQSF